MILSCGLLLTISIPEKDNQANLDTVFVQV